MVACRDFSVELIQSQMLQGVVRKQRQPRQCMSLLPEISFNVHCDTRTTLPGLEVVEVQGARGLPTL